MRNLTLKGKVIVFKTLALPKLVHFCLISVAPKQTIDEIEIIQKNFLCNRFPKTKHDTLCNYFAIVGLRNVAINSKMASLQCSCTKR